MPLSCQSPTDRALSEYAEIGYQCRSTLIPLCLSAGLVEARMVYMKVMRLTRINEWLMLEEKVNWEGPQGAFSWCPGVPGLRSVA